MDLIKQWSLSWIGIEVLEIVMLGIWQVVADFLGGMAKFGGALCAVILVVLLPCLDVALGQSSHPSEGNFWLPYFNLCEFKICCKWMNSSHNAVNALRAIKGRLVDPMSNLKNWNRGDPCRSNWTGVFCHKVNDDKFLHVTELYDQHLCLIYSLYLNFHVFFVLVLLTFCNELMISPSKKNQLTLLFSGSTFYS